MSEDRAKYKKQRRVYLIQSRDRVTRFVFPNIKKCVEFVNRELVKDLFEDLQYSQVSYQLAKFGLFEYQAGGVSNYIQRLEVNDSYIYSSKRVPESEILEALEVAIDLFSPITHAQFSAKYREGMDDWQVFDGNTFVKRVADRVEAYKWVEDQAASAQLLVF